MKAKRKSDGKIIEVRYLAITNIYVEYIDNADDTFKVTKAYHPSDLDFDVEEAEEVTIDGWVARDKKDNALNLHAEEPYRTQSGYQQGDEPDWWESECASFLPLDKGLFPSLTWESDPLEVTVTVKPKKK